VFPFLLLIFPRLKPISKIWLLVKIGWEIIIIVNLMWSFVFFSCGGHVNYFYGFILAWHVIIPALLSIGFWITTT